MPNKEQEPQMTKESKSNNKEISVKEKSKDSIADVTLHNKEGLNAKLLVEVKPHHYEKDVLKELKKIKKTARIKGFRKGKVPISYLKSMTGDTVKHRVISGIVQKSIDRFLKKEKMDILGSPIDEDQEKIDWKNQDNFKWDFSIGIKPDLDVKMTKKNKLLKYKVNVSDKDLDPYIENLQKQHGEVISPDKVESEDIIYCHFTQIDQNNRPVPNGIENTSGVSVAQMKDKLAVLGMKKGDKIWIKPSEINDDIQDLMKIFGVDSESVMKLNMNAKFACEVITINRLIDAEINKELFEKVYGKDVKTEKQFRKRLKEDVEILMEEESDNAFINQSMDYFVEKTVKNYKGDVLPEEFLRKWILRSTNSSVDESNVEEKYESYREKVIGELVENSIREKYDVGVNNEDLKDEVKEYLLEQSKERGDDLSDRDIEQYTIKILSDKNERQKVMNTVYRKKLKNLFTDKCKVEIKEISRDRFYKKVEKQEK